jgi:hypothetical protein
VQRQDKPLAHFAVSQNTAPLSVICTQCSGVRVTTAGGPEKRIITEGGGGGVISVCCRHNLRMQHTLQTTTQEIKQHTMPARPLTRQLSCLASYTRRVRQLGTVLKRARSRDSQPLHITFLTTSNFLQGHSMRISPTSYASPEVQQFSDVTSFRLLKKVIFIPPVL